MGSVLVRLQFLMFVDEISLERLCHLYLGLKLYGTRTQYKSALVFCGVEIVVSSSINGMVLISLPVM